MTFLYLGLGSFIGGILFDEVILPILQEFTACVATGMEVLKGHMSVAITKDQVTINGLAAETSPQDTYAIGFHYDAPEEEEYDEEEEEEEE